MNTFDLIDIYRNLTTARLKVEQELTNRLNWKELYQLGLTFLAIRKYRDTVDSTISLIEAKKAVESYFNR